MIPYGCQNISDDDIEAVTRVLRSDYLTQGPEVGSFEELFASYCGAKYAVAVSSCTAALHIAYLSLGMGAGKSVWTVPNTFVATANAALYCGATVDFVDIEPNTYLMCPNALEAKLKEAKKAGTLPDVVAPVHFSGHSCDMQAIRKLSVQYGFKIVEDAAHCAGASYDGGKVGNCRFSEMACFSFHPVKIITSAEGGVITTNDETLYKKLLMLRTHGITKDQDILTRNSDEPWYFEQQYLGYHYRITDVQCALASSQMKRLDHFVEERRRLVKNYNEKLSDLPITLPQERNNVYSSWHLYVVRLAEGGNRKAVFLDLREKGIGVNVHYIPVHMHPYYQSIGFEKEAFPVSLAYYETAITLPLYPDLTQDQQDYVCKSLAESLQNA